MNKINRLLIIALALSLNFLCISICYAKEADTSAKTPEEAAEKPIVVNVVKVTMQDIPKLVTALGSLAAIQNVNISTVTSGRISSINFKNGQQVAKGMPIVQLDNEQAQADYQSAVTAYQLARTKYERYSKLLLLGGTSKQELDVLKAQVATTKATVQSKLAALNQKQVVAPFSGVLGSFNYQVGDYVNAGDTLVSLVNSLEIRANYNVSEQYLTELHSGQLVQVTSNSYPKTTFYGTVTYISPTVSPTTRMVAVEANINNSKNLLSSGMFVHIEQNIGQIKNAIVIPSAAVSADIKGYFVYKVIGDKAAKAYLTIGVRMTNKVQVLKGLKVGDTIVVAGQQKLEDGSTIQVSAQGNS